MKITLNVSFGLLLLGLLVSSPVLADNAKGIAYYKTGQSDMAKLFFLESLTDPTAKIAETCYYLGKIEFAEQKADSASAYFAKGLAADPNFLLNYVGQAQLIAKKDKNGAEALINEKVLTGKNRKDISLQLEVARAFFDAGCPMYTDYLENARTLDAKAAGIYLLEGDALAVQKKYGEAATKYEQAIYYTSQCVEAYFKYAHIYASINSDLAIDMLKHLLEIEPGSPIALREMAEIYYNRGNFAEAARAYARYIESNMHLTADQIRYATILFFNKEYEHSLEVVDRILAHEPDNLVMQRLKMYDLYELKQYGMATDAANGFMGKKHEKEYISLDYIYYGRILRETKREKEAVAQFSKAIEMDSSKVDLYKEMAALYEQQNDYPKALTCYRTFVARSAKPTKVADLVLLGQSAYLTASADTLSQDSIRRRECLMTADSVFAQVAARVPDNFLGYFWRARTQASLDPETTQGLAKPYYEQALALLEKTASDIRKIVECYSYLGYYYYLNGDTEASKASWRKILAFDPENQVAQNALKGLK